MGSQPKRVVQTSKEILEYTRVGVCLDDDGSVSIQSLEMEHDYSTLN